LSADAVLSRITQFDGLACAAIEGRRVISPVPHEDAVMLAPVKDKASGWRLRAIL
jgi:hypothetical protein